MTSIFDKSGLWRKSLLFRLTLIHDVTGSWNFGPSTYDEDLKSLFNLQIVHSYTTLSEWDYGSVNPIGRLRQLMNSWIIFDLHDGKKTEGDWTQDFVDEPSLVTNWERETGSVRLGGVRWKICKELRERRKDRDDGKGKRISLRVELLCYLPQKDGEGCEGRLF